MLTHEDADDKLRAATDRLTETCSTVSADLWVASPSKGWSVSEIVEHVAIANELVRRGPAERLEGSPLGVEPLPVIDDEIPFLFYGGDEPPDVATPTGTWTDPATACEALDTSAQALLEWSGAAEFDLRGHAVAHPAFGLLDGVQWLLFVAAHTERHRAQIRGLLRTLDA